MNLENNNTTRALFDKRFGDVVTSDPELLIKALASVICTVADDKADALLGADAASQDLKNIINTIYKNNDK